MNRILTGALITALTSTTALAQTGRQLTTSPAAEADSSGQSFQPIHDTFWDERCADIGVTVNSLVLPNQSLAAPTISAEDTASAIQAGLTRWTDNPSSYIDMNVDATTPLESIFTRPDGFFDLVNESTFELDLTLFGFPPGVLAISLSTPLTEKTDFEVGDDINGDGDPDVFDPDEQGINTCADIDGDGDIEFPAGQYEAGSILENDVIFNQSVVWETEATAGGGADIDAVSTHEYGHSHGLTHSTINQISEQDGSSSTMFPSIATFDPVAELSTRTLHTDDLAASAFIYQEGEDDEGLSAVEGDDIAFEDAYTVFQGEIEDGNDDPILGAAVSAINSNGEVVAVTFSGDVVADIFDTATGISFVDAIDNGDFSLAVPSGDRYTLSIESLDGSPVDAPQVNAITAIAAELGQTVFPEETLDNKESSVENRKIKNIRVFAEPGAEQDGLDFVLNEEQTIRNTADATIGASIPNILGAALSFEFIEVFNRDEVLAALQSGNALVSGEFETGTTSPTESPIFSSARLALGTVDGFNPAIGLVTATVGETLAETENGFVGQDGDFASFRLNIPKRDSVHIRNALRDNPEAQLFLIASIDDVPSVSGPAGAIPFVSVSIAEETGASFFTIDGSPALSTQGVFGVPVNWGMELRTTRRSSN